MEGKEKLVSIQKTKQYQTSEMIAHTEGCFKKSLIIIKELKRKKLITIDKTQDWSNLDPCPYQYPYCLQYFPFKYTIPTGPS